MRIPHAAIAVALVVSPNDAFVLPPRQRNVRSQCLAMVVETPPELAEYMKTKLGTASAINVDDALDEARKERQRDATEAAAKREETIQNETQATMSPEVAEYLQTKLGITTRKLSKIETKVDRVETQTHLNAQLLRDANMKVDELTKKAEELTQRVLEIKKSSTSTIAKEEVTESKTTTEQMEATETTMSLLVAPTMIEKSANSETSLTMTLTRSTSPSPKTSSTMTVDSESPASQLAMARQARQRSQNEMKLRDEGLRNQAENRRRAWEQSKLRAEAKAKQKREKPEMVPESPEQENKFDMLARFEAWKEARDLSEDKRKQKKADLDKSVLLAHSEAKHKVPKEEQVSDIESELDQETKMRYDAWKRSKLQDATTGTTTKHVSSQSTMVDYRTSTSSSATKTPAAPESQTNVWPGSVPSSSTVPPTSPRFDPRSRSTPGDSTTIMVKAVRKDERNSIPSPSVPRATTQTSQYGQNEEPRVVLPVETVNFPAPADRPFFLEKPEGLYFLVRCYCPDKLQCILLFLTTLS